jgi:hypothetical protein
MPKNSLSILVLRKTLGTIILWGTVGLVCFHAFFYVTFGAAA